MASTRKRAAAVAISALLLTSGCAGAGAGAGASARDRDVRACKTLAYWIADGQPPADYPSVMTDVLKDAQDDTLRDELDELRSVRSSKSAEDWAAQLDVVSYRCLQIYEEGKR